MLKFSQIKSLFLKRKGDNFVSSAGVVDETRREDRKFPMFVVPIARAIEVTGRDAELPCHEDLRDAGYLVEYDPATMQRCIFFSHTWLRYKHPDSADGVKRQLIHELLCGITAGSVAFSAYWFAVVAHHMKEVSRKQVNAMYSGGYVWLDYWSIPQRDSASQGLAIQSIPYYVSTTAAFVVLAGPWVHENGSVRDLLAWNGRGWCRMEQVSNALSPNIKPMICATSSASVKNFGPAEVLGRLWFNEVVGKGAFAVEADKYALRDVIKGMLAKRQAQSLRDGNLVWYRTLRAMTSTILAGTDYDDEDAALPLTEWLSAMNFGSAHDERASGHTPLRYAVIAGRVNLVRELIGLGVDLHAPIHTRAQELMFNMMPDLTVLHQYEPARGEGGEIVRLLLEAHANPRAKCSQQQWQPIHLAVTSGCTPVIRALMAYDAALRGAAWRACAASSDARSRAHRRR